MHWPHWAWVFFGISGSGPYYGFWSGAGSDLGELTMVGAIVGLYRHHTCQEHRCWRLGPHPVEGTPLKVCRKHHPDIDHTKPLHVADHVD